MNQIKNKNFNKWIFDNEDEIKTLSDTNSDSGLLFNIKKLELNDISFFPNNEHFINFKLPFDNDNDDNITNSNDKDFNFFGSEFSFGDQDNEEQEEEQDQDEQNEEQEDDEEDDDEEKYKFDPSKPLQFKFKILEEYLKEYEAKKKETKEKKIDKI